MFQNTGISPLHSFIHDSISTADSLKYQMNKIGFQKKIKSGMMYEPPRSAVAESRSYEKEQADELLVERNSHVFNNLG